MSFSDQLLRWNWQRTVIVIVAMLAILQLYRANRPPPPAPPNRAVIYTASGPIVDAAVTVPAGDFVSYKLDLNRRANIYGTFWSGKKGVEITCMVADAANFEAWKGGKPARHVLLTPAKSRRVRSTGSLSRERITSFSATARVNQIKRFALNFESINTLYVSTALVRIPMISPFGSIPTTYISIRIWPTLKTLRSRRFASSSAFKWRNFFTS